VGKIEDLQLHENYVIYKRAVKIFENYLDYVREGESMDQETTEPVL
jgi:hypothetical protein